MLRTIDFIYARLILGQVEIGNSNIICTASFQGYNVKYLRKKQNFVPQVFNIPKVEHDQPCSTLVVIVFQISLFTYVILGPDWPRAKIKVNTQKTKQPKLSIADHAQLWEC